MEFDRPLLHDEETDTGVCSRKRKVPVSTIRTVLREAISSSAAAEQSAKSPHCLKPFTMAARLS
jgi:hypothetical protein